MAQYTTGICSTTAGSNVVTFEPDIEGNEPELLANVSAGDEIRIGDNPTYFTVASVDSDTQVTLTANYPTSETDETYEIVRDFSANLQIPLPSQGDLHLADMLRRAFQTIDRLHDLEVGHPTYTGFIFGDAEVTTEGDEYRIKVPGPDGATVEVYGLQVTHADAIGSGTSAIRVSDSPIGTSGASYIEADVEAGASQGDGQTGSFEVTVGDHLYVYIASAGAHQNIQFAVFARL